MDQSFKARSKMKNLLNFFESLFFPAIPAPQKIEHPYKQDTLQKAQKASSTQKIYKFIIYHIDRFINFLKNLLLKQGFFTEHLIKKYWMHSIILVFLLVFSIVPKFLPVSSKKTPAPPSLDSLVPKGFVLMPLEIRNSPDIQNIIGSYGVVDLYAYSANTGLPEILAASALKVLPPSTEEGSFTALVPEKSAIHLFSYTESFYAVIQNPQKTGSKIYKKEKKKSLIVIEEVF